MFSPEQAVRYLIRQGYDPVIFVFYAYRDYPAKWATEFKAIAWECSSSAANFQIEIELVRKKRLHKLGGSSEIVSFLK